MWQKLGAKRVVLARELGLNEIKKIRDMVPDIELEVFVHGAMCMTYSGRCQLSSYMIEQDGNHGLCKNTCRWKYSLVEEQRPGEYFPVYEDETGSYIYNSKDLCTIEFIDKLLDTGIDGLKIEGRMKGLLYGATTTKTYRQALDSYLSGSYRYDPNWLEELKSFPNRNYTSGFYLGKLDKKSTNRSGGMQHSKELAAKVLKTLGDNQYVLEVRNRTKRGTQMEILRPNMPLAYCTMPQMHNTQNDTIQDVVNPNTTVEVSLNATLEPGDLLRQPAS